MRIVSPKMYYLVQLGAMLYMLFLWIEYGIGWALIAGGFYLVVRGLMFIVLSKNKSELDNEFDRRFNEKFMELRRDYSHLPHHEFNQLVDTAVAQINKEVYG